MATRRIGMMNSSSPLSDEGEHGTGEGQVGIKTLRSSESNDQKDKKKITTPTRMMEEHGGNNGVSVFLLSTHHIPHALQPYAATTLVSTRLVEQCLCNYRDVLFLAREYGHRTELEGMQLRLHLLQLQKDNTCRKNDIVGATQFDPFFVEKQLWDIMRSEENGEPILLSEALSYQQILNDMNHLARGLLVPIEILRLRDRWILLQEDVQLNLSDRLLHYRAVMRQSPPIALAKRLWSDLWSLLGAAWRQRERLMRGYTEEVLAVELNGDISQLPPPSSASPSLLDTYCKTQRNYKGCHVDNESYGEKREEGDDVAFGPLLPHRVGITTLRHHAIRVPLLSFFRSLRVRLTTSKPTTTTTCREHGGGRGDVGSINRGSAGRGSGNLFSHLPHSENTSLPHVPFFDDTVEDVTACQVPYMSPEWFVQLRVGCRDGFKRWSDAPFPVHSYSDDVWNIAVLTLEFMLAGFSLDNSSCGHPDYSAESPTASLFEDIVKTLVTCHCVPLEAAQNFIYAALHEFSLLILQEGKPSSLTAEEEEEEGEEKEKEKGGDKHGAESGPTPRRLAKEWRRYLITTYGGGAGALLRDVAEGGLRWSRRERWKSFQAAHALVLHDAGADAGGTFADDSQRLLSSLVSPTVPLHPSLCAAAVRSRVGAEELWMSTREWMMSSQASSTLSLWDLQTQLRDWRRSVERHVMINGGYRKDEETGHNIIFKEFLHVVQQILRQQNQRQQQQEQLYYGTSVTENEREDPSQFHYSSQPPTSDLETISRNGEGLQGRSAQNSLLRGLMERSTLFSYRTDGVLFPQTKRHPYIVPTNTTTDTTNATTITITTDTTTSTADDDDGSENKVPLQAFPFFQAFLPMEDLLLFLRNDVASLNASPSSVHVDMSALDALVGVKPQTKPRASSLPLSPPPPATPSVNAGLLQSAQRVVRGIDLNVSEQLTLIKELRWILYTAPPSQRALRIRRCLKDKQAMEGGPYVPLPATLRGEVWGALLLVPPEATRVAAYHALNTTRVSTFDRQLAVDIPRCHQYHPLLSTAEGHGRLRRVMKAWILKNPELTYWQGVDSLCAILLAVSFTDEPLVSAQLQQLTQYYIPHDAVASSFSSVKSMEDHLHHFAVTLRYCDPCLAVYLLDEVECLPELFAISWFLTLLAHTLPVGKVCLLWDFLFVHNEAYPWCLTAMCLAVLLQQREQLLGSDFSACLSNVTRLQDIDIRLVLCDTMTILRSVPPMITSLSLSLAPHAEGHRCGVARVSVHTLLHSLDSGLLRAAQPASEAWASTGVFLVDLRSRRGVVEERVVGALLFPLATSLACNGDGDGDEVTSAPQISERLISQQATELLLQVQNVAMAALPPLLLSSLASDKATAAKVEESVWMEGSSSSVREAAMSPHIVLFTQAMTPSEVALAESFALEMVQLGTPHVSILLGGFAELKQEAPHLVVEFSED